ncbi:MAG: hypothetical protein ACE5KZ_11375 [Candidatus Scalinduaceae bacterium]
MFQDKEVVKKVVFIFIFETKTFIFYGGVIFMIKVKTFGSQLRIFHVKEELETLDKTVNEFIKKNKIKKVISVSDSTTANVDGGTIGMIRVIAYE